MIDQTEVVTAFRLVAWRGLAFFITCIMALAIGPIEAGRLVRSAIGTEGATEGSSSGKLCEKK